MKIDYTYNKDDYLTIHRFNLKSYEIESLIEILEKANLSDYEKDFIKELFQNVKQINIENKLVATREANKVKINKSKEKIQNAINLLKLEGKKITPYEIAKAANISYNTAKKYFRNISNEVVKTKK